MGSMARFALWVGVCVFVAASGLQFRWMVRPSQAAVMFTMWRFAPVVLLLLPLAVIAWLVGASRASKESGARSPVLRAGALFLVADVAIGLVLLLAGPGNALSVSEVTVRNSAGQAFTDITLTNWQDTQRAPLVAADQTYEGPVVQYGEDTVVLEGTLEDGTAVHAEARLLEPTPSSIVFVVRTDGQVDVEAVPLHSRVKKGEADVGR